MMYKSNQIPNNWRSETTHFFSVWDSAKTFKGQKVEAITIC